MRLLVVAALLASSSLAQAEAPKPAPAAKRGPKNPGVAALLSGGITLAGIAVAADSIEWGETKKMMLGLGLMYIGPSTGHWYAGDVGAMGLGLRALGAATFLYGMSTGALSVCDEPSTPCNHSKVGGYAALAGAALWIGSSVVDIWNAPGAARNYNQRHELSIAPARFRTATGEATGLVLGGRF